MSQQLYTCIDKGGTYQLLGVAKGVDYVPSAYTRVGRTIGAGDSKMESVNVYAAPNGTLVYEKDIAVLGMSHYPRHIYQDTTTKDLYHRGEQDFNTRMELIK